MRVYESTDIYCIIVDTSGRLLGYPDGGRGEVYIVSVLKLNFGFNEVL